MLKTRVVTALCLLALFLAALCFLPPLGWAAFAAVVAAIAGWEWGGLMRLSAPGRIFFGVGVAVVCSALTILHPAAFGVAPGFAEAAPALAPYLYWPAIAFWLLVVPLWMRRRWSLPRGVPGVLIGLLLIVPTWAALVQLRQLGASGLFGVMALVWLADIAAYFSGRTFGKHKLVPSISPGKTWEGAIGATVAVVLYGFFLAPHFFGAVAQNKALLLLAMVLLTAVSIIGDLFESLLKRQAGLKDSSNVLPGHGGVLDRIDSLTSTLPLVCGLWLQFT
ncbi:MAG: phosphatidate cytidylyltransferase [Candidatus Accumulibacter sp.]|nr:phosphatidate cytidylyltransferase [Accumulibacter sp.]MBA4093782.1 phosphatidate cytidylyltransferase [Accumulibacter sp.]